LVILGPALVILSPSPVTLSEAKGLGFRLRISSAKDLTTCRRLEILRPALSRDSE